MSYFVDPHLSLDHLLGEVPEGIAFVDEYGVICHANERLGVLSGYPRGELVGRAIEVLVQSRYRDAHSARGHEFARDPRPRVQATAGHLGYALSRQDGSELTVEVARAPFALDGKRWTVVAIRDESVQKQAEHAPTEAELQAIATELAAAEALANSERRFRLAFENNMDGIMCVDLEDRVLAVNDSFCQIVGRSREEIVDKGAAPFTHPKEVRRPAVAKADQIRYFDRYLKQGGRAIDVEVSKSSVRDASGATLYFVISVRDVTEEQALRAQFSHQALHDPLTGLANRVLFEDRLSQANARAVRQGGFSAVLLLDLDDFKRVNDTLGHVVGDQLLVALARRFDKVIRPADTLCRFGGDEFLYLAEGLTAPDQAEDVAKRLLAVLDEPFSLAGTHLEQRASVGVVVWDKTSRDFTELLQDADAAMYEAKRHGEGSHVIFTPSMYQDAGNRFELVHELGRSLEAGDLSMQYQPFIDLNTHDVVGFEALMRWRHPQRGQVPPYVFIPLAERSDLIFQLGSFALREAVREACSWERTSDRVSQPYVTVNFSARQFHDPDLVSTIEELLAASGLAPERLMLEITESVALADVVGTTNMIKHLDRLGVALVLDDFGTGYSSLSYLALLRPMIIKIDRSFVSPSQESAYNDTLLEAIVSLGQRLDMTVLAEGIETREQLERLRALGCGVGQGYLFSPAVPASEVAAMLAWEPSKWGQRLALSTPAPTKPTDQPVH
jgi:diguanylate cyclase (GGDEF)-like protein/PAS domain S-box-containing protein